MALRNPEQDELVESLNGLTNELTGFVNDMKKMNSNDKLPFSFKMAIINKRRDQNEATTFSALPIPAFVKDKFITTSTCSFCAKSYLKKQMDRFGSCGHEYCIYCLNTYCCYKIDVMEQVACPVQSCSGVLDQNGSVFSRLPQKSKDRYRVIPAFNPEETHLRHCPSDYCEGLIDVSSDNVQCPRC